MYMQQMRHRYSLFGQEAGHGVGSSHEQHHLSVEIDEERPQEPTRDPTQTNKLHINQVKSFIHLLHHSLLP